MHQIGPQRFIQFTKFPYKWGIKIAVRGWTQEIEPPYRTSTPLILRLPFYKALVFGKWTGIQKDEETALNIALSRRDVTYEDFTEEKGWTPAPESHTEESLKDSNTGFDSVDGTFDDYHRTVYKRMAEESEFRNA